MIKISLLTFFQPVLEAGVEHHRFILFTTYTYAYTNGMLLCMPVIMIHNDIYENRQQEDESMSPDDENMRR